MKSLPFYPLCFLLPFGATVFAAEPAPAPTPDAEVAVESAVAAPVIPLLAPLPIDEALARARAHLAARPGEPEREIVGAQFIPPHGRPGPGFWLVELAPYAGPSPAPSRPVSSLLIRADGTVEERGGRRPLDPEQTRDRDERAASLTERARQGSAPAAEAPAPTSP
jgi:hypothetical protein